MVWADHLCFGISVVRGPLIPRSGWTNYVEHKWSPWTTYAQTIYAVTVHRSVTIHLDRYWAIIEIALYEPP